MKTDQDSLHDALVALASTMSPNPYRLRQVRERVARRRRQRMAAGAAVSVGAVASAFGVAMVPRDSGSARQFNAAGAALPACASIAEPPVTASKPPGAPIDKGGAPDEKPDVVDRVARYKAAGVVVEVGAGTVTLGQFSQPGLVPPVDPTVMVIDASTTIENKGARVAASDLVVGQQVVFAASVGDDGRDHLDYLDLGVGTADDEAGAPKDPDKGATDTKPADATSMASPPAAGSVVKGKAIIDSAPVNNELTVTGYVDGFDAQSARLVLSSTTQYFRFETECTNAELVPGRGVLFGAVVNADGSYAATEIRTYE